MTSEKIIVVTGATGYVGRFVVAELQRQGVHVRTLARPESNRGGFEDTPHPQPLSEVTSPPIPLSARREGEKKQKLSAMPEIEWVEGSLLTAGALEKLVDGVDAVVHLAFEHVPGRYRGGEGDNLAAWLDANVNGSLRLLTAARDAQVEQFIFLSSRAVFSRTEPGRELDESHPVSPDTHYGAYKVAVEAFLQSFAQAEGMKTCSVRATGVYGLTWPVERSKWWGLIQAVLRDEPIPSSGGGTEVHGADVARVIWEVLKPSPRNPHPQPLALRERGEKSPALQSTSPPNRVRVSASREGEQAKSPPPNPLPKALERGRNTERMYDVIHMSDLYVTHREVVRLAREIAGKPGALPDAPAAAPANPLVCRRLAEMGLTLGGEKLLAATVAELVEAARESEAK